MSRQSYFFVQITVLFVVVFALSACKPDGADQRGGQMPPAQVDVAKPLVKNIVEWDEYVGRFEAVERVELRARVTGYLQEIQFEDGQLVKKGDVLFVIDQRPFEFALQRAEALYTLAKKEYERAKKLRKTSAISQEELDRRLQELRGAEAFYKDAQLDVEFTEVKSPIDGKISRDFINVGNLVRANETVLTRIVSVDPVHFYFETSQSELLKYLRLDRAGKRPSSDTHKNPVFIKLKDESEFAHKGYMDFVDNVVDEGTGTIQGRAIVPNEDNVIFPGMFGRVRATGSGEYEAILLPETAIQTDQNNKFVYVVNDEGKAERRYIELGPLRDSGMYIVRGGLSGTEDVVINGSQFIRMPNQPVQPVQIDPLAENGKEFRPDMSAAAMDPAPASQSEEVQGEDSQSKDPEK